MATPRIPLCLTVAAVALAVCAAGCLTARQEDLQTRYPAKRIFRVADLKPLAEEQSHLFGEWDRGGTQSLCVLQLAPGALLKKQFHAKHDLTLTVLKGRAIVVVETTRYPVGPGDSLLLPRLTAYSIVPLGDDVEFVALMVYSPSFEEADVEIVD